MSSAPARRPRLHEDPAAPPADNSRELHDLLITLRDTDRATYDAAVALIRALAHCRRRRRWRR